MAAPSSRWLAAAVSLACLLSAGNAALYWQLSSRIDALRLAAAPVDPAAAPLTGASSFADLPSPARAAPASSNSAAPSATAFDPVQFKARRSAGDPARLAADQDRLLTQEPPLPSVEQGHQQAIRDALQKIPADLPQPVGLQTTCRGRRCLVSGGFTDDLQANQWAQHLLLAGGPGLPRAARIITVPVDGGNGAVALQLYLH
ncbi:MAG: hypothetical protein J0H95_05970 [Xanthomonadales bacterium]|nr:hypothetical protein [Xanthomonadales bacterium]MBN8794984.1 hypothetical protein [Stenotrophomonas nitritireducens]